jgi:hypothetical protein
VKVIKTRPKIRLTLPAWSHPGDEVLAEVILDAKRDVPVDFVRCTLRGWERSTWGSGKQQRSYRVPILGLRAEPCGERELEAGTTRFRCSFQLEPKIPPTYSGLRGTVEYVVDVHASVPWWPDSRESFVLVVRDKPAKTPGKGRSLHSTAPEGPGGDEPHLEFSLNETQLLPGDTIRGELALSNVEANRYRVAHLALVGRETLSAGDGRLLGATTAWRYAIEIDVEHAGEGEPIPFAMKLPEELPPTFATLVTKLDWHFEIEVKIAWSKSLVAQVPVTVLPPESKRSQPKSRRAVLAVGNPRVRALWQGVADGLGIAFSEIDNQLRATLGDVQVEIGREQRDTGGTVVVGRVRYPSLHIALDGGVASGLRRVFGQGLSVGDDRWDKRHYVAGRDERQVLGFMKAMLPHLRSLRLRDISDEQIVVEARHAGTARDRLTGFAETVLRVGGEVERARRAIPIPERMEGTTRSWQALARRLGGKLEKARMAVSGRFEGAPAHVVTTWSVEGEPLHTAIAIETDGAVAERSTFVWSEGRLLEGDLSGLKESTRKLIEDVLDGALSLSVDAQRIELWDPAPIRDTTVALRRLEQLVALATALRGRHGPYR